MIFTEKDGENAFKLHKQIEENEKQRRVLFADNIELLSLMRQDNLYKAYLGDEKAPWSAYLAQLEVYYSQNEVYTYTRIYDYFVKEKGYHMLELSDIPKSRLLDIAVLKPEHSIELKEWTDKARALTSIDWNHDLREAKDLPVDDDGHKHEYDEVLICKKCGVKHAKITASDAPTK